MSPTWHFYLHIKALYKTLDLCTFWKFMVHQIKSTTDSLSWSLWINSIFLILCQNLNSQPKYLTNYRHQRYKSWIKSLDESTVTRVRPPVASLGIIALLADGGPAIYLKTHNSTLCSARRLDLLLDIKMHTQHSAGLVFSTELSRWLVGPPIRPKRWGAWSWLPRTFFDLRQQNICGREILCHLAGLFMNIKTKRTMWWTKPRLWQLTRR